MDGRVASLDDLPPSVVLPISEAARCGINMELRRLADMDLMPDVERTVVDASVVANGRYTYVHVVYDRLNPNGSFGRYRMEFNQGGIIVYGPSDVTGIVTDPPRTQRLNPAAPPKPKPWYHTTGKADYDYENAP